MIGSPLVLALVATAQLVGPSMGNVLGIIRDAESGLPLQRATVAALDDGRTAQTGLDGRYEIRGLAGGPHRVLVRALGHAPCTIRVDVPSSGVLVLNVSLQALPTQLPVVEVRRVRDTGVAATGEVGTRELATGDLALHPQLAEPDVMRGIVGGDVTIPAEAPGGLLVRGGSSDQTGYLLDGVPVFNPFHVSDLMGAWNTDALQSARLSPTGAEASASSTLSGALSLTTRAPGDVVRTRGGISTSHARFEADGPLGFSRAGFLISGRTAFPAGVAPAADPTFVRGESRDWLSKVEVPLRSGTLSLLATQAWDQLDVGSAPPDTLGVPAVRRNMFDWGSHATSLRWRRQAGSRDSLVAAVWQSGSTANASWGSSIMRSRRSDLGGEWSLNGRTSRGAWTLGVRSERSLITYSADDSAGQRVDQSSVATRVNGFAQVRYAPSSWMRMATHMALQRYRGRMYATPGASAQWTIHNRLTVVASADRTAQFVQSMRNPESVVGFVFPAEPFASAGSGGIPVAVSSNMSLSASWRLAPGWQVEGGGYVRRMEGVVVAGASAEGPFLLRSPAVGSAGVWGAHASLSGSGEQYRAMLRLGEQQVRYEANGRAFTPSFAPRWSLDGGLTVLPTSATSVRVGLAAGGGRRATPALGAIEWESCNLKDRGCEFSGQPRADTARVGGTRLPDYVRVDVGLRQSRALTVGSRRASVAWFATYSNVLSRFNVLTYTETGGRTLPIEMRPQSPFVVGLDWRF